jgi:hypothetical protein
MEALARLADNCGPNFTWPKLVVLTAMIAAIKMNFFFMAVVFFQSSMRPFLNEEIIVEKMFVFVIETGQCIRDDFDLLETIEFSVINKFGCWNNICFFPLIKYFHGYTFMNTKVIFRFHSFNRIFM